MDVPVCRICLGVSDEALISPCAGCRGSSAFVHYSCMLKFYVNRGDWLDLDCPTCKRTYEGPAAIAMGNIGLTKVEEAYGCESKHAAAMLTILGSLHGDLGDAQRERDLLERALTIKEKEYGPQHQSVAVTLTNLGIAHGQLGDAERMRDLLERALEIKEKEYGRDHREVAVTLTNLGNAYGQLGDWARQRDLLERALLIAEREYV
eukprot:gnl/TRDRNA2_/TRDRNA2_166487_c0_seq2.p1 gnl/TRDRNA2_/TRDRNA2_166487_c0~~gnl/TRDRNA2_/TRDRNA2_166487_c0_seq2.p1  ORF type:complete len:206 (-),score=27.22 gnl/TRDRNA2_/TRDRNA2_166487_c0_seq2:11-628(-)